MAYYIGIDIGGTKCAVTAAPAGSSEITAKLAFATNQSRGWKAIVSEIIDTVKAVMNEAGISCQDILAAGISCGGPLNSETGTIMSPPNLPDWDNVPVCSIIEKEFGFPVFLQNDANACALAEWQFGAGRGCRNMIFLTFGTGMGAGLILNGSLYSGTNDMAGEVGHIRLEKSGPVGYGKEGSFEGFCSGGGIARYAKSKALELLKCGGKSTLFNSENDIEGITAKSIAVAAENGDEFSIGIYRETGRQLGAGLSLLVDILNPECIVIGSIFARSQKLMRQAMQETLESEALSQALEKCRIVPAALGEKIGDYAALGVAQSGYERMKNNG